MLLILISCGVDLASPVRAEGVGPEFIRGTFVGSGFFLAVVPNTDQWMQIEVASEPNGWSEGVNIFTTNTTRHVIYVDVTAFETENRFYRAQVPGTSVREARQAWDQLGISHYRFRVRHHQMSQLRVLTGTVTVVDGVKSVSEVEINGEPTEEFDAAEFPSIEELFVRLEEAATMGVRLSWIQYDSNRSFPFRSLIDNRGAGVLSEYEVTEFVELSP